MNKETLEIIKKTLKDLGEFYSNNSCNDLLIPNCEENRKTVLEFKATYWDTSPLTIIDGQILTYDNFGIYLIEKELNL